MSVRRLGMILFLVAALVALTGNGSRDTIAAPFIQEGFPVFGWKVCEDLGMGVVPGVPGEVQRFILCHGDGWELQAYCLEPEIPPPPVDTICERIDEDTYWCGDDFQHLRHFQILQTPLPPTSTPTPTQTVTPSPTPTQTATSSPTSTQTVVPSPTPAPTETPTVPPVQSPTPRPPTGGKGNAEAGDIARWAAGLLLLVTGLALAILDRRIRDRLSRRSR